jgi:hypothetical protein
VTPAKQKQLSFALVDLYALCYEKKLGRKPTINRYREKWGFQDMLDSLGYERSCEVIEYYFTTTNNYSPVNLFNNFDRLHEAITKRDLDRQRRKKLQEQTRKMVEEWDAQHES